ncbi:MAG: ABC transporter permease [Candidatus Bipolaricaulota bacterium]
MSKKLLATLRYIPVIGHLLEEEFGKASLFAFLLFLHLGIAGAAFYQEKLTWFNPGAGEYADSSLMLFGIVLAMLFWGFSDLRRTIQAKQDDHLVQGQGYLDLARKKFLRDKKGLIGTLILLVVVYMAIFAPFFSPHEPLKMDLINSLDPPSLEHPFGTDNFGRDVMVRVIYGSRVALGIGAGAMIINMIWGGFLGLLGGYYKGIVDSIIMRLLEITNVIPYLVLVILVLALFRTSGALPLILILGIFGLYPARIIRSEVLSVREQDYVMATKALGSSDFRIIFQHILPNSMASLLVTSTMRIGTNIITVAGLSFLGFGITPPTPSWGRALQQAQDYMRVAPWMAIFPGLAIVLTVFAFNILGDSLRDVLDPRLK